MVAAECKPYAWTGGLGDIVGSLPVALREHGTDVRVAVPYYGTVDPKRHPIVASGITITVPVGSNTQRGTVHVVDEGEFPVYLIGSDDHFAGRAHLYGYPDDGHRFVFFARAALNAAQSLGWQPHVIHCHDWHAALIPNWLHIFRANVTAGELPASVLTIHNMEYQGNFGQDVLRAAGLERNGFLEHPTHPELTPRIIFLARGIHYAEAVSTVSPTYAKEILTPKYGERLDSLLLKRGDSITAIVNGIDMTAFDPASDPHLIANFSLNNPTPRTANKAALQQEVGLPVQADTPLIGMVTRLADHKGLDLVAKVLPQFVRQHVQLVVLGTGDLRHHEVLTRAAREHPTNIAVVIRFDPPLAQRVYSGSDIFLMPSRHEPCGLGQLIAMRYGSVPVVRATGGLADTVTEFNARSNDGTGFVFTEYNPTDMFRAISRALETYHHSNTWSALVRNGMSRDSSWGVASRDYLNLYAAALRRRQASPTS